MTLPTAWHRCGQLKAEGGQSADLLPQNALGEDAKMVTSTISRAKSGHLPHDEEEAGQEEQDYYGRYVTERCCGRVASRTLDKTSDALAADSTSAVPDSLPDDRTSGLLRFGGFLSRNIILEKLTGSTRTSELGRCPCCGVPVWGFRGHKPSKSGTARPP